MARMSDEDLLNYLDSAEANSIHASDELNKLNREYYDRYMANPWMEVADESKVQSTDVYDVIESITPSLTQVFLGVNEIHKFKPINSSDLERMTSEEKTKYINYLVRNQPSSFKTLFDWIKGALIYKYSAVSFGFEEEDTVKIVEYEGLSDDELSEIRITFQLMESKEDAEVDIENVKRDTRDGLHDIKVKVKKTVGKYFVRYVNSEDFVITSGAVSIEEAQMVGHDSYITKSDLVSMGYSKKVVKGLESIDPTDSVNRQDRLKEQGGPDGGNSYHWTGEIVKLETRYMKVDRDGDGIAERIKVLRVGQELLEDTPHEIAPYALLSSILMPGQAIGRSYAEVTVETQDIKTTLLRQTMMNMYQVNAARMAANGNVNMDDLLTQRLGGVVRVKGEGNPLQSMAPLPVPFIGDKSLMVLQYADSARAQRTGALMANQALDSDKLGQETATRFDGIQDAANSKVELIGRCMAETGFRELFCGMLWTVSHYQKTATEVMVLNKPLTVDPRKWLTDQPMVCNVGLAAGDNENVMSNMTGLWQLSQQMMAQGSPLTDLKKQYNILERMTKAMEEGDTSQFFNNPEVPEELMQAQIEALQKENFQLQQMTQGNPLAEAEEVKAQAELIKAQATQDLNVARLAEDQRQFNEELTAKTNKTIADLEQKYTELELKYNQDIPGVGQ